MSLKTSLLIFATLPIFYTSCSEMDKQLEIAENRDLEEEVMDIAEEQAKLTPKEKEAIKLKSELNRKRIEAENAQNMAARKAKEDLKEQSKLLAQKIEEEKAEAERIAEEKLQAEILELNRKLEEQKIAGDKFVGTKYEKLTLKNGKTLINATATEVRPTHVTFVHSTGIANVQFTDLKYAVRRDCKYDPELAEHSRKKQAELQQRIKARLATANLEAIKQKQASSKTKKYTTSPRPSLDKPESTVNVRPRGAISVRTIGIDTDGVRDGTYNDRNNRDGLRKVIEVTAISNVPATLRVNGASYSLTPRVKLVQQIKLLDNKYTATLITKDGKVLDEERHNRKTGL